MTALHITSANGYLEATSLLIEHGASANLYNYHYQTCFFLASLYGHLPILQILIELVGFDFEYYVSKSYFFRFITYLIII